MSGRNGERVPGPSTARTHALALDGEPQEIRNLDPRMDLDVFASEERTPVALSTPPAAADHPPLRTRSGITAGWSSAGRWWWFALPVLVSAIVTGAVWWRGAPILGLGAARVRIESTPSDLPVTIDGLPRGNTPLALAINVGTHQVVVGPGEGGTDAFEMRVEGGPQTFRVQLPPTAVAAASTRATDPPSDVPPTRKPSTPRVTTRPAPSYGWLAVSSPIALDIATPDGIIGTSRADKTMIRAGRHQLRLSNDAMGFQSAQTVTVAAGEVRAIRVAIPPGTISINAQPWANVVIDGARVGETPLGDLRISAGTHDIVFSHPELGERHQQVVVRPGQSQRVAVDMRAR